MPLMRRNITIRRSRAAGWARVAGGLALPVLALGVLGTRAGLVPQVALQPVLVAGFALGVVALVLAVYSLVDIWNSGAEGTGSAVAGIFYASPVLVTLGAVAAAAIAYPRLADVTTDVVDPPRFTAAGAPSGPPDAGAIARQRAAYPNIVSRIYPLPLGDVILAARKIVDEKGWKVARDERPASLPMASSRGAQSAAPAEDSGVLQALAAKSTMTQSRGGAAAEAGLESVPETEPGTDSGAPEPPTHVATIEAEAPTPVFGFLDDVVVRMEITEDGSTQVDVRSASRIGAHDLGQNARRIRAFFAKLDSILQPEPTDTASR